MSVEMAKQALAEGVAAVHDDDKCTCTDAYGPTAPYCEETMRANEAARYRIANARTREPLLAQVVLDQAKEIERLKPFELAIAARDSAPGPSRDDDPVLIANRWNGYGGTRAPDFDANAEDTASFLAGHVIELAERLKAMTACRDELAKIAAAREHPDRFPDFDVSLERIGKLRRVGHPAATVAAKWAACEEPPEGDGVRACNWTGEMSRLVTDDFGVTHCPGCGSTALKEDISP